MTKLLLPVALVTLWAPLAAASCGPAGQLVLWSHPADGATEVPTDVVPWLIYDLGAAPEVRLNGVALQAAGDEGPDRYRWNGAPDLAPGTEHTIEITRGDATATVTFRTGAGPLVPTSPDLTIAGHELIGSEDWFADGLSTDCSYLALLQGCYDTFVPGRLVFESNLEPAFWVLRPPGDGVEDGGGVRGGGCGDPWLIVREDPGDDVEHCLDLEAMDAAGRIMATTHTCATVSPPSEADPDDSVQPPGSGGSSCAAAPRPVPSAAGLAFLALLLVALARRRSH